MWFCGLTYAHLYFLFVTALVLYPPLNTHIYELPFHPFNTFPNKPRFLRVCSTSRLKTVRAKEKLLVLSNISFFHSVFYLFEELSSISVKFEIVDCSFFQFESLKFVIWERVMPIFSRQSYTCSL